jgi:hypothetical protein
MTNHTLTYFHILWWLRLSVTVLNKTSSLGTKLGRAGDILREQPYLELPTMNGAMLVW